MSAAREPARPPARYFEDYAVGDVHEFGAVTVSEEELVAFARQYDPQPFHIDAEAARESPFGGLGSSIISFHCATQPTVRASANSAVNMVVGKPMALSVMPE